MASKLAFTLTCPRPYNPPRSPSLPPISSLSSSSTTRDRLIQFNGRKLCLRRRLFLLPPKATADQQGQVEEGEVVDSKILPTASILLRGKAIMSNEEFDNLKEELMWEGSSVVMLSSDEQKFLKLLLRMFLEIQS
ncbi:hypothetical protein K1719_041362 [Acacia pycnantha]|nr:hypothetical protein K1719_041362 [Acacia pycnantha]